MITLHLAKLLEEQGFGTLDTDIFWEDMPIDSSGNAIDGLWIVPRGAPINRFNVCVQPFDIFSRYSNKLTGSQKLESILEYIWSIQGENCNLPTVDPYSANQYTNVRIFPTSSIENVGADEQDKIVRVISGEIRYKKEN